MLTKLKKQQNTFFELLVLKYTFTHIRNSSFCALLFILFYDEQPKQISFLQNAAIYFAIAFFVN